MVRAGKAALAVDFDPQFTVAADEAAYWTASLLRRANREPATFGWGVKNLDGYLTGVLRRVSGAPQSSRAAAIQLLQRLRDNLRDPQVLAQARTIDPITKSATDAFVAQTASLLNAFLARQSPGGLRSLPIGFADRLRPMVNALAAPRFVPLPA